VLPGGVGVSTTAAGSSATGALAVSRGEGGVAAVLAAVALIGVGAVAYLARLEVDRAVGREASQRGLLAQAIERGRSESAAHVAVQEQSARAALDELRARDAERAAALAGLNGSLAALEASLAQVASELARVGGEVAQRDEQSTGDDTPERMERLEGKLAQVQADLGIMARSLLDSLEKGEGQGDAADVAPAPVAAAFTEHLAGLASEDPLVRWSAIEALGATGDPAAAEPLIALLADEDLFVRMAAARVLGELHSASAVPPLIDALEDGEVSVREAALIALRNLTGRNIPFDPAGSTAERGRQVGEWREWWRRNGGLARTGG